jgi:hypothetical protein
MAMMAITTSNSISVNPRKLNPQSPDGVGGSCITWGMVSDYSPESRAIQSKAGGAKQWVNMDNSL